MPTDVELTRLTPEAVKTPGELKRLERVIAEHVRRDCPQVKWVANYAILGPEPRTSSSRRRTRRRRPGS